MLSHICISTNDFDRAYPFYSALMSTLGHELRFCERDKPWAGWHSAGRSRPFFLLCTPFDGQPHQPGNGQMTAFMAADRATVRAAYDIALQHGGTCEGPPGLRAHYHANYYGAYVRDPDGNKLGVACHDAAPDAA